MYTSSIDIRKVRCTPVVVNALPPDGNSSRLGKPEIVALSDDDSDSLDLSEPENNCPKKAKRLRTKRLERMERDQMRELDKIMSEEVRAPKRTNYVAHSSYLDSFNDSLELVERADENTAPKPSASTPQTVVIDREVDLFVIVGTSNETGKPGRIMTLLRDEPFDKLRPGFAKELNCSPLDVLIHVNNIDAGPGDTPDSMGIDVTKMAIVKVFSLKSGAAFVEDLTTDPNFIPVKCIFDKGRPRTVYICLSEPFSDAKKRIAEGLKLPKSIEKLVFDSEILDDGDTPRAVEMEAEDVIEIHFK